MYHWSELSKNYPASSIRKMAKLAAQFDDTLMLTMGEPNFETPEAIKKPHRMRLPQITPTTDLMWVSLPFSKP